MKIHAFRVVARGNVSLTDTLQHIRALPFDDRLRSAAGTEVRLEEAQPVGNVWQLDFGLLRDEGPGRASRNGPIRDFDLEEDEAFGEETAALFYEQSNFLILQYNHYGPKAQAVQSYLYRFARIVEGVGDQEEIEGDAHGFTLAAVTRGDAFQRLDSADVIRKLEFAVSVPGLQEAAASGRALSSVLDDEIAPGAATVSMSITAGRRRDAGLDVATVKRFVQTLLGVQSEVTKLKVLLREDVHAPSEPLDLLQARLEDNIAVAPDPRGRRLTRSDRWAALRQAHDKWRDAGLLR